MYSLDFSTVFFLTTFIVFSISVATLIFSLARKENRPFLWAASADSLFAVSFVIDGIGSSNPVAIIISYLLSFLAMIGFYTLYSDLIGVPPKSRRILILLFVLLGIIESFFSFVYPSLHFRILIYNIIISVISIFVIQLIISNAPRELIYVYILVSCPFINIVLIGVTRIISFSFEHYRGAHSSFAFFNQWVDLFYLFSVIYLTIASIFLISSKLQYELEKSSRTDALTSIYNRRALFELFSRELAFAERYNEPLHFIICDIDFFKKVNDTFGHTAGDAVLVHIVELIRATIRNTDIFARYGGEEFAIVLPKTENETALGIVNRLREKIEENPLPYEGQVIQVTCSFGITSFDPKSDQYEDVIKRADSALYLAKENGRNRVEAK